MQALHPNVRVIWAVVGAVVAVALGGAVAVADHLVLSVGPLLGVAVGAVVLPAVVLYAVALYRTWRYEVQADALYLERGVVKHVETAVPFVRIQHVDTERGPLERLLGLSSVVVYTAGSRGADVEIPGLAPDDADALHDRLRRLAVESEPDDGV
jgi:membrane protein YdbS with pleckstrin-like domain